MSDPEQDTQQSATSRGSVTIVDLDDGLVAEVGDLRLLLPMRQVYLSGDVARAVASVAEALGARVWWMDRSGSVVDEKGDRL